MSGPLLPTQLATLEPLLEALARRIVELQHQLAPPARAEDASPWMGIDKAAHYLDWPRQRLYKLTAAGAIPHYKHGGRLLFHPGELDNGLSRFAHGARE
jgi:excisionase family DNA binding protein